MPARRTDLLLEDLPCIDTWRLATELDVTDRHVGEAVARWYRVFHAKGVMLATNGSELPSFLKQEEDLLNGASIESTGRMLSLCGLDSWRLAADHVALPKLALSNFGTTLNDNDFHWTNLALSRKSGPGMEAIVFDYDQLGIGTCNADYRNLAGSLSGEAISGFREVYGRVDSDEKTFDRPLATRYGVVSAARMATFPKWAEDNRQTVLNGTFGTDLLQAVDLASAKRKRDATNPTANQATIKPTKPKSYPI